MEETLLGIQETLRKHKWLPQRLVQEKIKTLTSLLAERSETFLTLRGPLYVVGDTHGQFYDVVDVFSITGFPPDANLVFLGDYVDRGYYSIEVFYFLAELKIRHPNRVFLLRGNHESASISAIYGFYDEILTKYGSSQLWREVVHVTRLFPIAAQVDGSYFLVHGGLSPRLRVVRQLQHVKTSVDFAEDSMEGDLVWSDPQDDSPGSFQVIEGKTQEISGSVASTQNAVKDWTKSPRGIGYVFSEGANKRFLERNGFDIVVRSHQMCYDGFKYSFTGALITIWSAPNYFYRCGNLAAVLHINNSNEDVIQFGPAPDSARQKVDRCIYTPNF